MLTTLARPVTPKEAANRPWRPIPAMGDNFSLLAELRSEQIEWLLEEVFARP